MKIGTKPKIDFRYLALTPLVIAYTMLLAGFFANSTFFGFLTQTFGKYAIPAYFGAAFILMIYNQSVYYLLAKIYYKREILSFKDYIIVEIEPSATYKNFKLVVEDIGLIYPENNRIFMLTNEAKYDLTDNLLQCSIATAGTSSNLKAIEIAIDANEPIRVIKPIYHGFNILIQTTPLKRIKWFFSEVNHWNPNNAYAIDTSKHKKGFRNAALILLGILAFHFIGTSFRSGAIGRLLSNDGSLLFNKVSGRIENGSAFEKAAILTQNDSVLIVPSDAQLEANDSQDSIKVYLLKTLDFHGHPPRKMGIRACRTFFGAAYKRENGVIKLGTFGEWDSKIEGGAWVKMLITYPAGLRVVTSSSVPGDSRECEKPSTEVFMKQLAGTGPFWYSPSACASDWQKLTEAPDANQTAKRLMHP